MKPGTNSCKRVVLCGAAYEHLGLLWAARGTSLAAASVAANDYWTYSDVTILQASCYNRMKWLELQLGRLPHLLEWHQVDYAVRGVLFRAGNDRKQLRAGEVDFNAILGILLLRTDVWQLKWLSSLPDVLDELELFIPADALRYALGHEDAMPPEITMDGTDSNALKEFFLRLRNQPVADELPSAAMLCDEQTLSLSSNILGCRITAECDNEPACVALTESILAALEALLASGLVDKIIAREPHLTIRVRKRA